MLFPFFLILLSCQLFNSKVFFALLMTWCFIGVSITSATYLLCNYISICQNYFPSFFYYKVLAKTWFCGLHIFMPIWKRHLRAELHLWSLVRQKDSVDTGKLFPFLVKNLKGYTIGIRVNQSKHSIPYK